MECELKQCNCEYRHQLCGVDDTDAVGKSIEWSVAMKHFCHDLTLFSSCLLSVYQVLRDLWGSLHVVPPSSSPSGVVLRFVCRCFLGLRPHEAECSVLGPRAS